MRTAFPCRLLLAGLLVLALAQPGQAASAPVSHGPRDQARVALTFDLCQTPGKPAGFDEAIVEILERNRVAATFFVGGDWMRTHPDETRRLAAVSSFELADHSWSHPDFRTLDDRAIAEQLERTRRQMQELTGKTPRLFRFPFGYWNEHALERITTTGLTAVQWDLVTGDPDPRVSAANILRAVRNQVRSGSIVIMHANGRGKHTAEALQELLDELKRRHLEPVSVSELLGLTRPSP